MNVGILLVTHEQIGSQLVATAEAIICQDSSAGVLVLTDVYGATPDNLARYFARQGNARVVSGVNLPMLLRVLNYSRQSLQQLCETAVAGGGSGIQQGNIPPAGMQSINIRQVS